MENNIIKTEEVNIDVLAMLDEAEKASKEQGKIPVFLIPTVYGKGALIKREYEEYLVHEKDNALPVKLEEYGIVYDFKSFTDAYRSFDDEPDWLLFVNKDTPHTIDKIDKYYVLPFKVDDIIKDGAIGGGAFTPDELKYGKAYSVYCEVDLCLPDIRWKVTKPDMTCKGMHYELNKLYEFEGEAELHEAGYHYAWNPNILFTWYRRYDPSNEVYLVQVSGGGDGYKSIVIEDEHGVGVTDRILFVKKIEWKDLL